LLIIVLLGVGGFFIGREIIISWGVNSFKNALKSLEAQSRNGSYATRCQNETGTAVTGLNVQTHLRFTSDTEYVLEATCDQVSTKPILISKHTLPPYISKVPGTSGILWGEGRSAVELEVFHTLVTEIARVANLDLPYLQKRVIVGIEAGEITEFAASETELGEGPVTSCTGYGFSCCQVETHIGVGESISGLNECPDTCFSSCSRRPVVLSFTTSPFTDPRTREVASANGGMVDFNYVIDTPGAASAQVTVDFGDGAPPAVMDETSGKVTHQYICDRPSCIYIAKISAVDTWQVSSYDAVLNSVKIVVQSN
jgi:hypothetical protein